MHKNAEIREEAFKDWCMEAMGRISVHLPSHVLVTTVINLFSNAENSEKEDDLYEKFVMNILKLVTEYIERKQKVDQYE